MEASGTKGRREVWPVLRGPTPTLQSETMQKSKGLQLERGVGVESFSETDD